MATYNNLPYQVIETTGDLADGVFVASGGYEKIVDKNMDHDWGEGEVTKEPTCTEKGVMTYICNNHQAATKTEEVAAKGHAYGDPAWTWSEDNSGASVTFTCANDQNHKETEKGWEAYETCTRCDYSTYEEIDELAHTLTHVEAKAATTDAEGNIEYWHCTACDKYFRDAQATQEITQADTVIEKLTPSEPSDPSVPTGPSTPSVTTYRLTINYVFEDGGQAASTVRRSLSSGSSYSVSSPAVEGYTPDQSVVEGRLNGDLTVTVTYTKDQDVQEPDTPLTGAPVDTVFADVAKDA